MRYKKLISFVFEFVIILISALDAQSETIILNTLNDLQKDKIILTVAQGKRRKDWADQTGILGKKNPD